MKRFIVALILLFSLALPTWAIDYYCDPASVGGDGTTTALSGANAAFKTLAAAQAALTGDQSDNRLLLNKGATWRETLTLACNGTAGHPFTVGAYGTGVNPILCGSIDVSGDTWEDLGSNIWRKNIGAGGPMTGTYGDANVVFNNNQLGTINATPAANYQWTYTNPYLKVYATSNPNGYYSHIEAGSSVTLINFNGKSYVNVTGLTITGCNGIEGNNGNVNFSDANSNGCSITNCTFTYSGGYGIRIHGTNIDVSYCNFSYMGVDGIVSNSIPSGSNMPDGVDIHHNTFGASFGRQCISMVGTVNSKVRDNTFSTLTSAAIDLEPNPGDTCDSIEIYNNTFTLVGGTTPRVIVAGGGGTTSNISIHDNTFDMGRVAGSICVGGGASGTNSLYNNTMTDVITGITSYSGTWNIYGNYITANPADTTYGIKWITGTSTLNIYSNILQDISYPFSPAGVACAVNIFNNSIYGFIRAFNNNTAHASLNIQNNIFYTDYSGDTYFYRDTVSTLTTSTNNCFFAPNASAMHWQYGATTKDTFVTWQTLGFDAAPSFYGDPLFTNDSGLLNTATDFFPDTGSPAIGVGVSGLFSPALDYYSRAWKATPSVGAIEPFGFKSLPVGGLP